MPRDQPRYLGKTGGITHDPARALRHNHVIEPEAVDANTQMRFTLNARRDAVQQREVQRGQLTDASIERRIQRCKAQARVSGVRVQTELRLVRLAIEGGRPTQHVERRLERLEQRLWPLLSLLD